MGFSHFQKPLNLEIEKTPSLNFLKNFKKVMVTN